MKRATLLPARTKFHTRQGCAVITRWGRTPGSNLLVEHVFLQAEPDLELAPEHDSKGRVIPRH